MEISPLFPQAQSPPSNYPTSFQRRFLYSLLYSPPSPIKFFIFYFIFAKLISLNLSFGSINWPLNAKNFFPSSSCSSSSTPNSHLLEIFVEAEVVLALSPSKLCVLLLNLCEQNHFAETHFVETALYRLSVSQTDPVLLGFFCFCTEKMNLDT